MTGGGADPDRRDGRPGERPVELVAEATLVGSVVAFHVVDHRWIPERFHAATHLGAGLAAVTAAARLGVGAGDLGLSPSNLGAGLRSGLLAAALTGSVVLGGSFLPALAPVLDDPRAADLSTAEVVRRSLIDIPIGTAVYEELVFRSALLGLALRRWPPTVAVVVSSGLFGLWHILPAIEDRRHNPMAGQHPVAASVVATVAGTTVAGVLFGRQRLRTGSVVAPMLTHAAVNVAGLLAAVIADRRRRPVTGP